MIAATVLIFAYNLIIITLRMFSFLYSHQNYDLICFALWGVLSRYQRQGQIITSRRILWDVNRLWCPKAVANCSIFHPLSQNTNKKQFMNSCCQVYGICWWSDDVRNHGITNRCIDEFHQSLYGPISSVKLRVWISNKSARHENILNTLLTPQLTG